MERDKADSATPHHGLNQGRVAAVIVSRPSVPSNITVVLSPRLGRFKRPANSAKNPSPIAWIGLALEANGRLVLHTAG